MGKKKSKSPKEREPKPWEQGISRIRSGPLGLLAHRVYIVSGEKESMARDSWACVTNGGRICLNTRREAGAAEWEYVIGHCLLHLGLGHFRPERRGDALWQTACDYAAAKFLKDSRIGSPPERREELPVTVKHEEQVWDWLRQQRGPVPSFGVAGSRPDMVWAEEEAPCDYTEVFAESLQRALEDSLRAARGLPEEDRRGRRYSGYLAARDWFLDSYPLLGAVASAFRIVDDLAAVRRMEIPVAAVSAQLGEIYINPLCDLNQEEWRFVLAHEYLHAALRHDLRCEDRDPALWNVACDYVVNGWLTEMRVGAMPALGLLDQRFRGMSAEGVYDLLLEDVRRYRKENPGDVLYGDPAYWDTLEGQELDRLYRSALGRGLELNQGRGRGTIPAGLMEEIHALARPPIRWDVELGKWFDLRFPQLERRRTYARMSRRQSAAPEIPRPAWRLEERAGDQRTFGVVLDTSGSMDRSLLAAALGSIASYSQARDVRQVRVVFCDAAPYDQGFMDPADIAGTVEVRGRGGTRLQPGIDLLERAADFPKDAPLLIITDGYCDRLNLRGREHAYLVPWGNRLPFPPRGPVFKLK